MPVELICVICSIPFKVIPSRARTAKYCCYRCHQVGEGRKGGEVTGQLHQMRSTGKSYPKLEGRHIHRIVAENMLGRPLRPGEIVHHKDGNKQNFQPENIEIHANQSEHMKQGHPEFGRYKRAK